MRLSTEEKERESVRLSTEEKERERVVGCKERSEGVKRQKKQRRVKKLDCVMSGKRRNIDGFEQKEIEAVIITS